MSIVQSKKIRVIILKCCANFPIIAVSSGAALDKGYWLPSTFDEEFPEDAVLAGYDVDDSPIFVGRAKIENEQEESMVLLSVIPNKKKCLPSSFTDITMADIKEFEVCIGSQNIKQYFFHTS
jgi:hypothetical protein